MNPDDEPPGYFDAYRWSCPTCGRFIAAAAVNQRIWRDDSTYYGISESCEATCPKCGPIEPNWRPTRWIEVAA